METVEEHPVIDSTVDNMKLNKLDKNNVEIVETNVCHKSNGVDSEKKSDEHPKETCTISESNVITSNCNRSENNEAQPDNSEINEVVESTQDSSSVLSHTTEIVESVSDNILDSHHETEATEEVVILTETIIEDPCSETEIITDTVVEINNTEYVATAEQVKFETEIFVEKNDNDLPENDTNDKQENDTTNNILNELGQNIELSEVLRSSDISENNNSTLRQEVFNKEELLDILEGNDIQESIEDGVRPYRDNKMIEEQIALQQLSKLSKRKRPNLGKSKKSDKKNVTAEISKIEPKNMPENNETSSDIQCENVSENSISTTENIVNELVMDWQDDEPVETSITTSHTVENLNTNITDKTPEKDIKEETTEIISIDSSLNEEQIQKSNKSGDESAPRRLSRVIKKKVIYDPDNPVTYAKGKTTKIKEIQVIKDQTPTKKIKKDELPHRSKSKSPLSKLQWKKPTPKNSKQYKRLTEVDKLLMDEGAVNMIYQLTPEAPKGRKNMRKKAEFIKKIQSSTPDSKEMKFRERKKESLKYEDGEAKHILKGKHRISLSGSVKSPSVSEDFETHSADDSIIYRRHSSSSYSSSCMSPRRLSDVEGGAAQVASRSSHPIVSTDNQKNTNTSSVKNEEQVKDVFKNECNSIPSSDIINKDDCLSIKEKLNSKLSLALNKRKRESSKIEKPIKQKKIPKISENIPDNAVDRFKYVSILIDQRLAVISIKKKALKLCAQVLKELEEAFNYIDSRSEITITLIESKCATICSKIDLSILFDENNEISYNNVFELAESIRLLLSAVWRHSKLVWCGVSDACAGVALALAALSDVALCAESATFSCGAAPPLGAAALARSQLPQALVNDLVIFSRQLSASEALQGGLVNRILWPGKFDEQVYSIAEDIAAQPPQAIKLKKKLLCLNRNSQTELFLSSLEAERDLLVEYWISPEGQPLMQNPIDVA